MISEIAYSIVIPVYNSHQTLAELTERIDVLFKDTIGKSYEIIFINDGSSHPQTSVTLSLVSKKYSSVRVIELTRNFGQQAATICGIENSRGNYIITMDDDLQHFPEDIALLLREQHHDIVIGKLKESKHGFGHKITSAVKSWFDRHLLGKPKGVKLSSFRLIQRTIAEAMVKIQTPYPYLPALMFYVTKDVVNAEVRHEERKTGKSGYSFFKQLRLISNLFINNSSILLKAIAWFGITLSFVSFGIMIYFIVKKITMGIPIEGWTSLMVTLSGIGGILLFAMGILGEYLIRMLAGIEKRPTYIIRHRNPGS